MRGISRGMAGAAILCSLVFWGCEIPGMMTPGEVALTLTSIEPTLGSTRGNQQVTVRGDHFAEGMQVTIGNRLCTNLVVVSPQQVQCQTPSHVAAVVDVSAALAGSVTGGATLPMAYTYGCTQPDTMGLFVWANDGGEKITNDQLRASCDTSAVINSTWDGERVSLVGAKNEVLGFNLVLEAYHRDLQSMSVSFDRLVGPGGFAISSAPATGNGVFNYTNRDIEIFFLKYLQIRGLSKISYYTDDERQVPSALRRPFDGNGRGRGTWADRPNHDKFYPDIAVPQEWVGPWNVADGTNQSIWVDVYIPKNAPAGLYEGIISIKSGDVEIQQVPVSLAVRSFSLPDAPSAKTAVYMSYNDLSYSYIGAMNPESNSNQVAKMNAVVDRHFAMAHRHKIMLIDDNNGGAADAVISRVQPRPEWVPRLDGTAFTSGNGYRGPGESSPNDVFSIGTYGIWQAWWGAPTETSLRQNMDAWEGWFAAHAPNTTHFLFLTDEPDPSSRPMVEQMAQWAKNNPGIGHQLRLFGSLPLWQAVTDTPSLDMISSAAEIYGTTSNWTNALATLRSRGAGHEFWLYNGKRPATGSFAIEDDGVALRELAWAQMKLGVDRWFVWQSTYYNDYQSRRGATNVFQTAQTFGATPTQDPSLGLTSGTYGNGNGVLFYPGTDLRFPAFSFQQDGPIASLRLKLWRRGLQDADYIALARSIDPVQTNQILQRMVPKAAWEYGAQDTNNPTFVTSDISWTINSDIWEQARLQLADIIESR